MRDFHIDTGVEPAKHYDRRFTIRFFAVFLVAFGLFIAMLVVFI